MGALGSNNKKQTTNPHNTDSFPKHYAERSQTHWSRLHYSVYMQGPEKGKTIDTQSKLMIAGAEEGGDEEGLLMVMGVSFGGDENVMG